MTQDELRTFGFCNFAFVWSMTSWPPQWLLLLLLQPLSSLWRPSGVAAVLRQDNYRRRQLTSLPPNEIRTTRSSYVFDPRHSSENAFDLDVSTTFYSEADNPWLEAEMRTPWRVHAYWLSTFGLDANLARLDTPHSWTVHCQTAYDSDDWVLIDTRGGEQLSISSLYHPFAAESPEACTAIMFSFGGVGVALSDIWLIGEFAKVDACRDVDGFIDPYGWSCAEYSERPTWCDDEPIVADEGESAALNASVACCACGGGVYPSPSPPPPTPSPPSPPLSILVGDW